MIAIFNSRASAKETANAIHLWRQENVPGYTAESWANCHLSDKDYDAAYKHQTAALWYVPIPGDYPYEGETVDELPEGWRPEPEGL